MGGLIERVDSIAQHHWITLYTHISIALKILAFFIIYRISSLAPPSNKRLTYPFQILINAAMLKRGNMVFQHKSKLIKKTKNRSNMRVLKVLPLNMA